MYRTDAEALRALQQLPAMAESAHGAASGGQNARVG
jgi:SulP family sulfate permease